MRASGMEAPPVEPAHGLANIFSGPWKAGATKRWGSVEFCVSEPDAEALCRWLLARSPHEAKVPGDLEICSSAGNPFADSLGAQRAGPQGVCLFLLTSGREACTPDALFPVLTELGLAFNSLCLGALIRPLAVEASPREASAEAPDEPSGTNAASEADFQLTEALLLNFVGELVSFVQESGRRKNAFKGLAHTLREGGGPESMCELAQLALLRQTMASLLRERHEAPSDSRGLLFIVSTSDVALRLEALSGAVNPVSKHMPALGLCDFDQILGEGLSVVLVCWRTRPESPPPGPPDFPGPDGPGAPGGIGRWRGEIKRRGIADCVAPSFFLRRKAA